MGKGFRQLVRRPQVPSCRTSSCVVDTFVRLSSVLTSYASGAKICSSRLSFGFWCESTDRLCIPQALREASEAEASARTLEERASIANAETAEELRDTQERLRGVEVILGCSERRPAWCDKEAVVFMHRASEARLRANCVKSGVSLTLGGHFVKIAVRSAPCRACRVVELRVDWLTGLWITALPFSSSP